MSQIVPRTHGPWIDLHAHPGRCFLRGLGHDEPLVRLLGSDHCDISLEEIRASELAAVSFSTVSDLRVLSVRADGSLVAVREFLPGEVNQDHRRQVLALRQFSDDNNFALVRSARDVTSAHESNATTLLLGCEGADFVEGDWNRLDEAYSVGVRMITIVHYRANGLGDLQTEAAVFGGLSLEGRQLIREMNRLGIVVDLAHATWETTRDAVEVSTDPIIISHSHLNQTGANHARLIDSSHARAVTENGGLIGAWPSGVTSQTFDDFLSEVARLVDVVGIAHVSIGTDMDANFRPVMTRYGQYVNIADSLRAK